MLRLPVMGLGRLGHLIAFKRAVTDAPGSVALIRIGGEAGGDRSEQFERLLHAALRLAGTLRDLDLHLAGGLDHGQRALVGRVFASTSA